MNMNTLENLARQALKGNDVAEKSEDMLNSGFITPAEHRSVNSLSWQIAANVRASGDGASAGTYAIRRYGAWF